MSFSSFGLHPQLLRAIEQLGFSQPTPIQAEAIAPGMAGRDLLACAMTGSGKTAAFLLPILQRLIDQPRGTTRALVLSPTRELAAQIDQHLSQLARYTNVSGAAVFGGVAAGPQEAAFRRGVDVMIATPGRLLDHLKQPYARFDALQVLVLDEADRMLDMGFLPDIKRILRQLPADRQTMFFSATMPAPIVELSRVMLRQAVSIDIERRSAPATGIYQALYPVSEELKPALFVELLRRGTLKDVIVFTRTKHRANRLADFLSRAGMSVARIHGNRSQAQRTLALDGFKKGEYQVLVATDIVARGIDVEELSHVVNFDVPHVPEDYIHRVGRTARAEATGDAFTFVSREEEGDLRAIERAVGRKLPRLLVDGFDYEKRAGERFEVPAHERMAALRTRRADERRRAQEKVARRSQREQDEQARRDAKSARPATRRSSPAPTHAAAAHARHAPVRATVERSNEERARVARVEQASAAASTSASAPRDVQRTRDREADVARGRIRGAWSPSRDQAGEQREPRGEGREKGVRERQPTRRHAEPRSDASRGDAPRGGASRSDSSRSDGSRSDLPRSDAPRSERPRREPARRDPVRAETTPRPNPPRDTTPGDSAGDSGDGGDGRRRRRGRRGGRGRKRESTPQAEE